MPVTELTVIETEAIEGDRRGVARFAARRRRAPRRADRAGAAARGARPGGPARRDGGRRRSRIPNLDAAIAVRVGYGDGDSLVDGRYEAALEVPREAGRKSRASALRPQERMAALLGGRERALVCEELILRARADLDAGRVREATMQIRVGLEAMLAERDRARPARAGP